MADKDAGMEERRGGIFGGRREQGRTPPVERSAGGPAREDRESPLPELKITQAVKSPEPIVKVEPNKPITSEDGIIQPYREYTIALAKDSKEIQILDGQGRKIEGLTNTSTMIFDWPLYEKDGKTHITETFNHDLVKKIDTFPKHQRSFLKNFYEKKRGGDQFAKMPNIPLQMDTNKLDSVLINITSNNNIVIIDSNGFIAFQTRSAQGIELPPRNWKRVDLTNEELEDLPQDIKSQVAIMEKSEDLSFIQQIGGSFNVLVDKDKLAVAKLGQTIANAEFTDRVANIGQNVCLDPKAKGVIYYCATDNPKTILKLDTTKEQTAWQTEAVEIPQQFKNIKNLRLDPTGNFFTFESSGDFVFLDKDSLQEVKRIPKLINAALDDEGRIRGIDEKGNLVVYDANFQEVTQELEKRRVVRLAQGLRTDLFKQESAAAKVDVDQFKYLVPVKTDLETQFNTQLQTITNLGDISTVTEALGKLRLRLQSEGLQPAQIAFITQGIQDSIGGKERILAAPVVAQGLVDLNTKLAGNLTIAAITEAKGDLSKLKSLEGLVDETTRAQIRAQESHLSQQSDEFYRRESPVIEKYGSDIVEREIKRLEQIVSKPDFDDWQEHTLPQQLNRLGTLISGYPPDAPPETLEKLMAFSKQLRDMDRKFGIKFKERYAEVRQKGSAIMNERKGLMEADIVSFADRLRERGFKDRLQAETYIGSSEALGILRSEIEELKRQNPDTARELDRTLKVQIANIMFEIERGGQTTIAETGQQMEWFGNTSFPKWEGELHEKSKRQFSLVFIVDKKSMGPGITPDKILGDIGIREINSRGKMQDTRLYEGMSDEDKYRLGSAISRQGDLLAPSYISQAEFRGIMKDYADWNKGDASNIRREFNEKIQEIKNWYKQKQEIGKSDGLTNDKWNEGYRQLLYDYASFSVKKHILIFNRIDNLKKAPETAFANGKGAVEEWQNYWVRDPVTEGYLEEMAQILKMQLKQQSGILTIRGNPGAGKDVLVSMFSERTNRPYFGTDCTKWDTAYEFSEDIVLESKDGASQTVHVPSTVLNGITTPGAIVYLNEIHALTEPAQIFLHALTDAKRRITLKTSSGKVIKALDSVVLMASMNPQVKDPIEPALRDRMVFMDVDYPPLNREKDSSDPNPNPPIDASEALRIAREVNSLSDLTIDSNMDRNEFVRMWDKHINGIDNGAASPSKVQEFDMDVILATVQFANKLRENFVAFKSGRTQTARGALPVSLPATGRPLRDCAYALSDIPDEEKIAGNPEAVAKTLLERWFLSKIDNIEDRDKIKTAMATWTSSKRPAA